MHPHQHFLDEFKIAIEKLVPLTPSEIVEEAKKLHAELEVNPVASEEMIRQALRAIGRKEYPYRKAFQELCESDEEQRLQAAVFDRLDPEVAKKVKEVTAHGVILEDYVASPAFEEQLTAEERYQVTQAILIVDEILENQCDDRATARKQNYLDLVAKYENEARALEEKIAMLAQMAEGSSAHGDEIQATVDRLNEGWSVVERDPSAEEIEQEIAYWKDIFAEEAGE